MKNDYILIAYNSGGEQSYCGCCRGEMHDAELHIFQYDDLELMCKKKIELEEEDLYPGYDFSIFHNGEHIHADNDYTDERKVSPEIDRDSEWGKVANCIAVLKTVRATEKLKAEQRKKAEAVKKRKIAKAKKEQRDKVKKKEMAIQQEIEDRQKLKELAERYPEELK